MKFRKRDALAEDEADHCRSTLMAFRVLDGQTHLWLLYKDQPLISSSRLGMSPASSPTTRKHIQIHFISNRSHAD